MARMQYPLSETEALLIYLKFLALIARIVCNSLDQKVCACNLYIISPPLCNQMMRIAKWTQYASDDTLGPHEL